jgi:hypothetical protein
MGIPSAFLVNDTIALLEYVRYTSNGKPLIIVSGVAEAQEQRKLHLPLEFDNPYMCI